jgi:uncharacterized protein YjbI with pentapeptide repeats
MGNVKTTLLSLMMALSFGTAYGQTVSIDGGNIRVDASSGAKASVVTNGEVNSAGKKRSKAKANVGDQESTATTTNRGNQKSLTSKTGLAIVNADLSGQNLSRKNYAGASFTNVEAVGTNFRGADLSGSTLTNVDLSNSDMRGVNLTGAQATNVDWNGALLEGAIWIDGRHCGVASVGSCK